MVVQVRIERCERVQLIAAAARVVISSCHDCILHLGVNSAPLLIGDNRFLQVRFLLALLCTATLHPIHTVRCST